MFHDNLLLSDTDLFGYKTEFFSFQNNPKNLALSYNIRQIRCLGLFSKGKTCNTASFHRTDVVICSHSQEGKTLSYS